MKRAYLSTALFLQKVLIMEKETYRGQAGASRKALRTIDYRCQRGAFFQDILITQKSKDVAQAGGGEDPNKSLRSYKLIGAWPSNVGAINLAYDSNDAIEEFDVEFQYQYLDAGETTDVGELTGSSRRVVL